MKYLFSVFTLILFLVYYSETSHRIISRFYESNQTGSKTRASGDERVGSTGLQEEQRLGR